MRNDPRASRGHISSERGLRSPLEFSSFRAVRQVFGHTVPSRWDRVLVHSYGQLREAVGDHLQDNSPLAIHHISFGEEGDWGAELQLIALGKCSHASSPDSGTVILIDVQELSREAAASGGCIQNPLEPLTEPLERASLRKILYDVGPLKLQLGRYGMRVKGAVDLSRRLRLERPDLRAYTLRAACAEEAGVSLGKNPASHTWAIRPLENRHLGMAAKGAEYIFRSLFALGDGENALSIEKDCSLDRILRKRKNLIELLTNVELILDSAHPGARDTFHKIVKLERLQEQISESLKTTLKGSRGVSRVRTGLGNASVTRRVEHEISPQKLKKLFPKIAKRILKRAMTIGDAEELLRALTSVRGKNLSEAVDAVCKVSFEPRGEAVFDLKRPERLQYDETFTLGKNFSPRHALRALVIIEANKVRLRGEMTRTMGFNWCGLYFRLHGLLDVVEDRAKVLAAARGRKEVRSRIQKKRKEGDTTSEAKFLYTYRSDVDSVQVMMVPRRVISPRKLSSELARRGVDSKQALRAVRDKLKVSATRIDFDRALQRDGVESPGARERAFRLVRRVRARDGSFSVNVSPRYGRIYNL